MIAGKQVNCYLLSVIGSLFSVKLRVRHFVQLSGKIKLRQTYFKFPNSDAQKKDGHSNQNQSLFNDVRKA